jgi:HEPN domain-containing protein
MRKETEGWLRQAGADLKAAGDSLKDENFEWACFQSQQAEEKALKACLSHLGYTSSLRGHSLKSLLKECISKKMGFSDLEENARFLDDFYIPTRYPNGLEAGLAPVDYYDEKDAQKCLDSARSILTAVMRFIKK